MSLKERLLKRSTLKSTAVFAEQELFQFDKIPTEVPLINLALTGKFDEGVTPGLTVLAAPSKHFKSMLGLVMVAAYLKKYDDAVCLFVDSEFGASKQYFKNAGIDPERVIHIPVLNVEEAKFELTAQLDEIQKGDHVIIFMDSIGNLASKKEADDALDQKSVADMGRAKQIKSLFRIITPHLTLKNIPMVAINHTIQTMEMFSKTVMTSGCLTAGTKVQLADNTSKNIEEILPGDIVKTLLGPREVTHTWLPEDTSPNIDDCYEIEFEDGLKIICSNKHKFFVNGKWIAAEDLTGSEDIITL